jgi:hypothetical protein
MDQEGGFFNVNRREFPLMKTRREVHLMGTRSEVL